MVYADSTYYTTEYHGTMPVADFDRLSRQASTHLDRLTFGRIQNEWISDARVKDACCAVADVLYRQEQGGEVTSETTGGWSRSYTTTGKTAAQSIRAAARLYLGNTGLMYCGVNAWIGRTQ